MGTQVIVNLLAKVIIYVLLGFLIRKFRIIDEKTQKGLNKLLLQAILPVTILVSSQNDLSTELLGNIGIVILCTSIYFAVSIVIMLLLANKMKLDRKRKWIFVLSGAFANVGFIGFPIAGELFGAEGILYTVAYNMVFQLIFFSWGIAVIGGNKKKINPWVCIRTPVMLASIVCVLLFIMQVKFPIFFYEPLNAVGSMTTPISMILIGCSLCDITFKELISDRSTYVVALMRMLVFPICMIGILNITQLPTIMSGTLAVLTALPTGTMISMYSQEYDADAAFAVRTNVLTMVMMTVTLPITILIINYTL